MLESGGKQGNEEFSDRYHSLTARALGGNFSAQRQHCRRMIVSRVSVRQIPAHRSHIPHLRIGYHFRGVQYDRVPRFYKFGVFEICLSCETTYSQVTTLFFYVTKIRNTVDIDEIFGSGEAHLHQGDEALPAAQDFGVIA